MPQRHKRLAKSRTKEEEEEKENSPCARTGISNSNPQSKRGEFTAAVVICELLELCTDMCRAKTTRPLSASSSSRRTLGTVLQPGPVHGRGGSSVFCKPWPARSLNRTCRLFRDEYLSSLKSWAVDKAMELMEQRQPTASVLLAVRALLLRTPQLWSGATRCNEHEAWLGCRFFCVDIAVCTVLLAHTHTHTHTHVAISILSIGFSLNIHCR